MPFHRGHAAAIVVHTAGHRLQGWLVAPPRSDLRAASPPRRRGPPWFTTLGGALAAMGGAGLLSLATSLWWLLWARATVGPAADEGALAIGLAILFGSLVNLVAVVGGCWSATLARRSGPGGARRRAGQP